MDRMHVCICYNLNTTAIEKAIAEGAHTLEAISEKLGLGSQCGTCVPYARELIESILSSHACVA